ncbi:hypothetical protein Pmani_010592 [Petrolisthes manimaculis]|uniref:Mannosyltransferase n=1 Tax=Petrolisthes manimaculis TaxID=1843537 RepID=A0AAE1UFD4_9EUCA|nr:hypothetical protein Pmani_010592 [Petrolisthes manimaculis]
MDARGLKSIAEKSSLHWYRSADIQYCQILVSTGEESNSKHDKTMASGPMTLFLTLRLLSTIVVQTWFVPDEYWQAPEIAHRMVFGYGYKTWEWREGIRGALYPTTIAALYKMLETLWLDYPFWLIHLPRILHALLSAWTDHQAWHLSKKLYGHSSGTWTSICLASSWFLFYCAPRTLTSCVEMALLTASFRCYPWRKQKESRSACYLWTLGLACAVRPTAAVPFLPLCLLHIYRTSSKIRLLVSYFFITATLLGGTIAVDSWFYGRWVFVPWNFAKFNVLSGLSAHYGIHPWHWYLTQGVPATFATHLLPLVLAGVSQPARHKEPLIVCVWSLLVYSCLAHKEFRFLLPLVPLCLCVAGDYITLKVSKHHRRSRHSSTSRNGVLAYLVLPNLVLAFYISAIHQRGPLEVMSALADEVGPPPSRARFLFLTPCHSTPYYSYLHRKIPMQFLTCEPNLTHKGNYTDEADVFEKDPEAWLQHTFGEGFSHTSLGMTSRINDSKISYDPTRESHKPLPSHIIMYNVLRIKQTWQHCWTSTTTSLRNLMHNVELTERGD